ncbi:methyltransferase domain-containing protein [Nocardioidaceae bacterium]|nr:methyltransferase domain-containing protein [Nocardioidaceae bacterium]
MSGPRYPHGHDPSVLASHSNRTVENSAAYLVPFLRPGLDVLDLGSGPGTITADLARRTAPGHLIGVEMGEESAALTRAELVRQGLDADRWDVLVGDGARLDLVGPVGLADDSFDVAHAHQVLQYVADPPAVLAELARVVRAGGVVAVRDTDYGAWTWSPDLPELDEWRALYQRVARADGGEPDAGRRLLGWAHAAGLAASSTLTWSTWLYADQPSRAWWGGVWERRILESGLAARALEEGWATREDLHRISAGWARWARTPAAMMTVPHGELIIRL